MLIYCIFFESHGLGNPEILAIQYLLDHDNHVNRDRLKNYVADPLFIPRYDLTLEEERELAYQYELLK